MGTSFSGVAAGIRGCSDDFTPELRFSSDMKKNSTVVEVYIIERHARKVEDIFLRADQRVRAGGPSLPPDSFQVLCGVAMVIRENLVAHGIEPPLAQVD